MSVIFTLNFPPNFAIGGGTEIFVLIFFNQFHLCQLMFQSFLFAFKFQQITKSQKER